MKKAILSAVVGMMLMAVVIACAVYSIRASVKQGQQPPIIEAKPDTVYIHDTLRIVEPTPIEETEIGADTVWLERIIKDSIVDRDTVYVRVPISQVVYENNRYKAVIQGYHPRLVSLDIYTDKTYVYSHKTIVKPAKLSLSAGIYGGYGPRGFDYGLGIMLGIPIFSWTW